MSGLDPLLRVLLVTDGTLTDALEAIWLEPVGVRVLDQQLVSCESAPGPLDLAAGEAVLERRILLRGAASGRVFAHAESVIAVDRLDPAMRAGLLERREPIGRLWAAHRVETFKEMLEAGARPAGDLGVHFGMAEDAELLSRRYVVSSGGRPVMMITESLPAR